VRPSKLARRIGHWLGLVPEWLHSRRLARQGRGRFDGLQAFVLFVGYPRSGHSLVGSLLDAHPDVAIAHELHVLRYLKYGFSREQIFAMLLENAADMAASGRTVTGYSYAIPGQWQGRARSLRVLGDKRGGTTIRKLRARPWLLPRLERRIALPLRFVHVLRNPFDNIATIFLRGESRTLDESIEHYFRMVEGVAWLKERLPAGSVIDVRHEDLVADPADQLTRLCGFLGVEPEPGWLSACGAAVWKETHRSRDGVAWTPAQREEVEKRMARHAFLTGYGYTG
jgi:hypothetical protein